MFYEIILRIDKINSFDQLSKKQFTKQIFVQLIRIIDYRSTIFIKIILFHVKVWLSQVFDSVFVNNKLNINMHIIFHIFSINHFTFFCLTFNLIKPYFTMFTKDLSSDIDVVIEKYIYYFSHFPLLITLLKHVTQIKTWYLSPSSKISRYSRNSKILCTRVDVMMIARIPVQITTTLIKEHFQDGWKQISARL